MGELCASRAPYAAHLDTPAPCYCLPIVLRDAGYRTTAIHAYSEPFFDRHYWYPNIGFEQLLFGEQMIGELHDSCGGIFRGVCDSDLGATVLPWMITQDGPRRFVYWVTLNTHVPVRPGDGTPRLGCSAPATDPFGHRDVCFMTGHWLDVFDAVTRLALPTRNIRWRSC